MTVDRLAFYSSKWLENVLFSIYSEGRTFPQISDRNAIPLNFFPCWKDVDREWIISETLSLFTRALFWPFAQAAECQKIVLSVAISKQSSSISLICATSPGNNKWILMKDFLFGK